MWVLLDHLGATLVAATVTLLALGVMLSKQRDGVAASARAASVGSLASTTEWIERDLNNLGAGLPADEDTIVDFAWHGEAPSLTFVTGPDTSVTAPPRRVRYERAEVGRDTFQLRRYAVTPTGDRLSAQSPPTLLALNLVLMDRQGEETAQPDRAHAVSIHLTMAPPLGAGGDVEWSRRFVIRASP